MLRYIFILSVSLFMAIATPAKDLSDSAFVDRYNRLFNTPDSANTFYDLSALRQEIAKRDGDIDRYYSILANEVVFEATRGHFTSAVDKANNLIEEIKENGNHRAYYNYVYKALGSIFEQRGNCQMATSYYEEALSHLDSDNDGKIPEKFYPLLCNLYTSLARVSLTLNPDTALKWNEHLKEHLEDNPKYIKPYLSNKAQIHFYKGEWDKFLRTKQEYDEFLKSPKAPLFIYGEDKLALMENVVTGNHEAALRQLDSLTLHNITKLDVAMRIHEIMGRQDLMKEDAYKRIHIQDSLNNEVIHENLNALNVTMGMNKLQVETARKQELWMAIIIVLLVIVIGLLIWRYRTRHNYLKRIKKQNDQLEMALDKAQESDRMKTTFIKHISHEMRTPMNIISGFVQIVINPDYQMSSEERHRALKAIDENIVALANIVNNLLELSLGTSKERYTKDDEIDVNKFCRYIMDVAHEKNHDRLQLNFESSLPEGFTIKSSKSGIEHIIRQVYGNSLKFTEKGYITFSVERDAESKNVSFIIKDSGIGIPKEHQDKVFEQFFKVDSFKQGLGIGLPMSRKIATLLGGTLTLDKNYRDGTRMVFTIPVK